jgi:hypothetical protein
MRKALRLGKTLAAAGKAAPWSKMIGHTRPYIRMAVPKDRRFTNYGKPEEKKQ